ncbi:U-box domain-containing protein kinase family protein [Quillaja saponaria]|uniref:RING-type E3 ubiquitin transferase n=1 Tax=Quillaja saponaria TaxID=32244 RepID=A0AAD7PVM9_QUISA|nr:U-box domain-containing protein kinase family protein [Quillaja saponaria]
MGSIHEVEEERVDDLEETVHVAVGKDVEESEKMLLWAVQNFAGKKICLLHVYQPDHVNSMTETKLSGNELKYRHLRAFQELERQELHELLDQYLLTLARAGVQANKVWIEMDNIEKGIVEIIVQHNIRWLVMGAAEDNYHSGKLAEPESRKAIFVLQQAPHYCIIWFVCRGNLISTWGGRSDRSEEDTSPLLLLNSDNFISEYVTEELKFPDKEGASDDLAGTQGSFSSHCSGHPDWSLDRVILTSKLNLIQLDEDERYKEEAARDIDVRLQQAIGYTENSKRIEFKEAVKRWEVEDTAMEAKCKAKALESLSAKEISSRKEMEDLLEREKQEVEKMKNQRDELMGELSMVRDQNSVLESKIVESQCMVTELEEKIISAVELLISFKDQRDKLKIHHSNIVKEVKELGNLVKEGGKSFYRVEFPTFSFIEINEVTHEFDPSWKIAEGRYGSVYRGFLCHMHVAIKMLPSYGCQSQLEFQHEVEVLSRVRHPNLLTLVGSCPESRSLIYEYLRNASLEDHLVCRDNAPPLPWQIRICIAADICSALIFLHSNEPCIIHGNLKPSKVLLDANFSGKLGDLGIFHLVRQSENSAYINTNCKSSNEDSVYMDPEYLATGKLTPESDVYSFGIILLRVLTGRPLFGVVRDVKCALENEKLKSVLDSSSGEWPLELAKQIAYLALRCCENTRLNRPELVSEIWSVLEPLRASFIGRSLISKKLHRIPTHFVCPIFQEVMEDPHIAADGFTYEAEAIRGWLKSGHHTSPMTNLKLENDTLVPNYALHNAILEWQQLQ